MTPKRGLSDYIHFYSNVYPYRESFVIGLFDEVTTDFGKVIDKVNTRFSTHFNTFNHNEPNEEKVFRKIEEMKISAPYENKEEAISRPSEHKEKRKEEVRTSFKSDELKQLKSKAHKVYEKFL